MECVSKYGAMGLILPIFGFCLFISKGGYCWDFDDMRVVQIQNHKRQYAIGMYKTWGGPDDYETNTHEETAPPEIEKEIDKETARAEAVKKDDSKD